MAYWRSSQDRLGRNVYGGVVCYCARVFVLLLLLLLLLLLMLLLLVLLLLLLLLSPRQLGAGIRLLHQADESSS